MDMSFLIDPILLILCGITEVGIYSKFLREKESKKILVGLSIIVVTIFWLIAGLLYLDYIDMPGLGEYGKGNHFMWNSGIELLGLKSFVDTSIPTYTNPLGPMNILAIAIFLTYPLWLYLGIKLGYRLLMKTKLKKSWK